MKRKTIEQNIKSKMLKWIATLPESLREDLKSNIVVSGGCITSMFLKEPVNDYDVYIQDKEVLLGLANWYCRGIVLDGAKRIEYLNNDLNSRGINMEFDEYQKELNSNNNRFDYNEDLSEKYIRYYNLKEDQIKLDINGEGKRVEYKDDIIDSFRPIFLSPNAISLSDDLQLVLRFHGTVEQIHKTYDFIHATNYYTFKEGLVTNVKALECVLTKELKYQGSLYPLTSIIRMKKFIHRGWTMNAGEVLKMMYQVSQLNLNDIKVLEEQLIGIDVAYFSTLISLLRNEKESFNYKHLSELIDKIFNKTKEEN